jgi:hypothetical protein
MAQASWRWQPWLTGALLFCAAFGLSHWVDARWEQADDAYITYQYARRLAAGEGFTFSPGAPPVYGTTTPLWTLILAVVARAGIAPHVAAPWLTSLGHGTTAALVFLVGSAIGGFALGLTAGGMVALSFSVFFRAGGMETALVTALSAALALLLLRGRTRWWPGALLGLLLLARPDAGLLAAVIFIAWATRSGTRREVLLPNALLMIVIYLPWAVYALWAFHDLIPWSLRAKAIVAGSGEMSLRTFRRWFLGGVSPWLLWVAAAICMTGAIAVWLRAPRFRPFAVWAVLYCAALAAGGAPDFLWYYVPPLWVGFLFAAAGLQVLVSALPQRARARAYSLIAVVAVSGYAVLSYRGIEPILRPDNPYRNFHLMLATKLAELAEPGDMVAAPEVGCIAYFSGCRVLDIRGVTCPEVIVRARARNLGAIIRHWKPDFVVILGGDGEPAIQQAYTDRFRARYWNGMDYVIWERALPANAATGDAPADRSSKRDLPPGQAQQPDNASPKGVAVISSARKDVRAAGQKGAAPDGTRMSDKAWEVER